MKKIILPSLVTVVLAAVWACSTFGADPAAVTSTVPEFAPVVMSKDFHITVETNRETYFNRDVLRLTIQLLNNSPDSLYLGFCPMTLAAAEAEVPQADVIEEVEPGLLDDMNVDVAIMPPRQTIIGYATLTRLGPSPMPQPLALAEDTNSDADAAALPTPAKYKLPLFGESRVPGHSSRIISTANILIAGPLLEVVALPKAVPGQAVAAAAAAQASAQPVDIIPAVGKVVPLKPGYYLLDCQITGICNKQPVQAQKIICIRKRWIRPLPMPAPNPPPAPKPTPAVPQLTPVVPDTQN